MSLSRDGVWKGGIWSPGVWADGVWFETPAPGGSSRKKRKKWNTLRKADYSNLLEYEQAVKVAVQPAVVKSAPIPQEDPDDELLLAAVSRLFH